MKNLKIIISVLLLAPCCILAAPITIYKDLKSGDAFMNDYDNWMQFPYFWCWFNIASGLGVIKEKTWQEARDNKAWKRKTNG